MQRVLENLPRESRVAVLRFRSLGDCVLTTPALEILKRARPDLRVAVVVEDRFRDIFEGNPDVDEILPPELSALRRFRPALAINFHGGTRSAWMTALSAATYRAGFGHFRLQPVYNLHVPRAQEILGEERTVHTAEHLASAMFWLGAPRVEIPRAKLAAGRKTAEMSLGAAGTSARATNSRAYAVIHAAAAAPEKAWRADGFVAVGRHLKESGLDPVVIGTVGDDLTPFAEFRTVAGAPLSEIKILLSSASLFVGNDSGPAHMAAAFGLPVVVIFGKSDPRIWGPWRTASEVVRAQGGIQNVGVAQVIAAAARMRVHA
ncbi:MAG TPA: glycosyltransferase family 9 protein [Verrucomicrobiae bacterium]|nr:glycosyltransferase family 9 protein [Verrucomicrobiae bacterium]